MERYLLILLLSLLYTCMQGQAGSDWVIAKYRNGITYVGEKVDEQKNIFSIKINTRDTIHINRFHLSRYYDSNNALIFHNGKYIQTQGGFWNLNFGFNALSMVDSLDQRVSTHLEVSYGRRISDRLNIAVGLGFEFNEAMVAGFQFDTQFSSIFAQGRYYLNNSPTRLFVFSRIGIGYPSDESDEVNIAEHSGGFNSLTGLGLQFASRNRSNFQLSLGFYTQKTNGREFFLDNIGNEVLTNFDILIKRLMLKFGWDFG